jgi:2-polyprenyl-3-methyl-5-hydroxy-6-metoxy-1,4-benzoquinol methylase
MTGESLEKLSPRTQPLDQCPVCASPDTRHFFSAKDRLHGVPGEFSYHICNSCRSVFQNPMVIAEDLHLCYPAEYTPYNIQREIPEVDFARLPNGDLRSSLRKAIVDSVRGKNVAGGAAEVGKFLARFAFFRERAFYGLVTDDLLPKRIGDHFALDVGCGAGWLMQKLTKVGWKTEGLEWNEKAAQRARDITGLNVWAGDFREVDLPKNHYDLIVLNHVFEHFAEPKEVLSRVYELLTTGGKAVFFYPNPSALGATWYQTYWFAWEVPRHLILPTRKAFQKLAEQAGFRESRVRTRAFYPQELWISSTAYVRGLNPDRERPSLALSEKLGVLAERSLNRLGFEKGWEIVAVLEK